MCNAPPAATSLQAPACNDVAEPRTGVAPSVISGQCPVGPSDLSVVSSTAPLSFRALHRRARTRRAWGGLNLCALVAANRRTQWADPSVVDVLNFLPSRAVWIGSGRLARTRARANKA